MEREIKFRVWTRPTGMMNDVLSISFVNKYAEVLYVYDIEGGNTRLEPFEFINIMQFTGLKDKNGTEIYEGDIVRCGEDVLTVTWNKKFASFCLDKSGWMHSHYFGEAADPSKCEVIGNIHLNPELLTNN